MRVRNLFASEFGIQPSYIVKNLHLTVYHARRSMAGVRTLFEPVEVIVPAVDTRFMVMAPGGENPRPGLDPAKRKVGVRVHRRSSAMPSILSFRERLLRHETREVLGSRKPSTHRVSAFGARYFQPHMTVLRPGNGVDRDLTKLGKCFREALGDLKFDRFEIQVKSNRRT